MIRHKTALLVVVSALLSVLAPSADANRFFKCKDADGNTVLSQFPCAEAPGSNATAVGEGNATYARSAATASAVQPDAADAPTAKDAATASATLQSDKQTPATAPDQADNPDTQHADDDVVELSEDQLRATRRATPAMQRAGGAIQP